MYYESCYVAFESGLHCSSAPFRSDEVYALSVFKEQARFTSALLLAQQLVGTPSAAASSSSAAAENGADGSAAAADSTLVAAAAAAEGNAAAASLASLSVADGSNGGDGSGDGSSGSGGSYSQRQVDTYMHMVYGLSKDWCASGLRVGMLYSRNTRLQKVGGCSVWLIVTGWVDRVGQPADVLTGSAGE